MILWALRIILSGVWYCLSQVLQWLTLWQAGKIIGELINIQSTFPLRKDPKSAISAQNG